MDKEKLPISIRLKSSQSGAWKRVGKVVLATLGGLAIAYIAFYPLFFHKEVEFWCFLEIIQEIVDSESKGRFQLFILIAGLPVFLTLWAFRTYDKNNQLLFGAIGLLGDDSTKRQALALSLAFLRNKKKVFIDEIDQITQGADLTSYTMDSTGKKMKKIILSDLDLQGMNFKYANFNHTVLKRVDLQNADLIGADLQNADLTKASLQGANIKETEFSGAFLYSTDLRKTKNIKYAFLKDAYHNETTKGYPKE